MYYNTLALCVNYVILSNLQGCSVNDSPPLGLSLKVPSESILPNRKGKGLPSVRHFDKIDKCYICMLEVRSSWL